MSDAATPATDGDDPDAAALADRLDDAAADLEAARERVAAVGADELEALADQYRDLTALFDRYEEDVTGDGDFQTFIEFQSQIAEFTEELPDDARHRDVFEDVDDLLQQRRLTASDWDRVRDRLEPVRADVERLEDREAAREQYRELRLAVQRRRDDVEDRIEELTALQRLGEADLDAPTERLRDPVETYNERVRSAFDAFVADASARTVLDFLATTERFPLVPFRAPPAELREYVADHDPGTESVGKLREYAGYSRSKLDHYVDDPDALKRNVATNQTYLDRLDADPLTVGWPPPEADTLRYRCRELTSVVARIAGHGADGEAVLVALRTVRDLPRETDYERLRASAQARAQLGEDERERLASGAVAADLEAARSARDRLEAALADNPAL